MNFLTYKSEIKNAGSVIEFTAGQAYTAGDVVQIAGQIGIIQTDVASGDTAVAALLGRIEGRKTTAVWVAGDVIGWDANGSPYGGTALSGAFTNLVSAMDFQVGTASAAAGATANSGFFRLNEFPNILALGGFLPGAVDVAGDALVIPVTHGRVAKTTGDDAEALTLANGTPGQKLQIDLVVDGNGSGTLTPTTKSGFATIVFADAGDQVVLQYLDGTLGWIIIGSAGVAAPPVITI